MIDIIENNEEEYLKLLESIIESYSKLENIEEELRENNFNSITKKAEDINSLIEKIYPNSNWYDKSQKEQKEMKGIIAFLTPILKLKSNKYLEIDIDNMGTKIYLSRRGFFKNESWRERKLNLPFSKISQYLTKVKSISKFFESKMNDEEKNNLKIILDYLKFSDEEEPSIQSSNDFKMELDREITFYDNGGYGNINQKTDIKLKEIDVRTSNFSIGYLNKNTNRDETEHFEWNKNDGWNLSMIIPIRKEIENFLDLTKTKLEKMAKKKEKEQKDFKEFIAPYLLLDKL